MAGRLGTTRRATLAGLAAAAAAPVSGQAALPPRIPVPPATFVLVHGAWHGGWCWRDVARRLRDEGHRVLTPTMTGLGERRHLGRVDTGLAVHVEDIAAVLRSEELVDIILVAHSYAGIPCSYAAGALAAQIRRLVYLDSLLPSPGKAFFDDTPPAQRTTIESSLVDGFRLPSFPAEMFDVPKDHPRHAWLARRLTDMPITPFTDIQPPLPGGLAGVPKTYVRCTLNSLDGPKRGAELSAAMGMPVVDLDSGHDAMVTAPAETAALLEKLSVQSDCA